MGAQPPIGTFSTEDEGCAAANGSYVLGNDCDGFTAYYNSNNWVLYGSPGSWYINPSCGGASFARYSSDIKGVYTGLAFTCSSETSFSGTLT